MRELTALEQLAQAMAGSDPVAAKTAKRAMAQRVHASAAPGADKKARAQNVRDLLTIARANGPRSVRAHALYLLGFIGGRTEERALSTLEADPEVGEDVRMARERIRKSGGR
jgi:hypothetical protein